MAEPPAQPARSADLGDAEGGGPHLEDVRVRVYEGDAPAVHYGQGAGAARLAITFDDPLASLEAAYAGGARDADTLYGLAYARLHAGDPRGAIAPIEALLAREPERVSALELAADVCERAGDVVSALSLQDRAVAALPRDGERHARRGRLLALLGERRRARDAFEEGAARDPRHFECARRAAVLHLAERAPARAGPLLEAFLEATAPRKGPPPVTVRPHEPQLTARDVGSRLRWDEGRSATRGRLAHEVAAHRFQARGLLAAVRRAEGNDAEAARELDRAADELLPIDKALLVEVAALLEASPDDLALLVETRREERGREP